MGSPMRMRITARSAKAAPVPADGQALYFDDEVRGFGVRVTATGVAETVIDHSEIDARRAMER